MAARNQALAANMKRLRGGRSIAELRADMAEKGVKIGAGTLHRAIKGEAGNRLESLAKIADFFETTVDQLLQFEGVDETYWPFSDELQKKVLALQDEELRKLENVMRAHLGMKVANHSEIAGNLQIVGDKPTTAEYAGATEEGAGPLEEAEVPAPTSHARHSDRRSTRQKGGSRH